MKKRIIAAVTAAVIAAVCIMTALPALAADSGREVYVGSCGKELYWFFDTDIGVLTIYGTGDMYNYYGRTAPWNRLGNRLLYVVVEEGVESIGEFAFYGCPALTSVELPDTLTRIGAYAFRSCASLMNVELPEGLTFIGGSAFRDCDSMTRVVIPDSVVNIGNYAFRNCDGITSVELGESVERVGFEAFHSCDSLISVVFKGGVPRLLNYAFGKAKDNMVVYYTPEYAEAWAPEGETEWNGLTIAPLEIPAYVGISTVSWRFHAADDGKADLRFLAEGARLSDDTPELTEIGFEMMLEGYACQVVNCNLRYFSVDGRFVSYVLFLNNIPAEEEVLSRNISVIPYVKIGDGVQYGAEINDLIYMLGE